MDLNRNYGFHYAHSKEDNNECDDTYRGPYAFSEPETTAIKNLVEKYPQIVSAMNFHAYGNIWIKPFNFLHRKEAEPTNTKAKFLRFYKEFEKEVVRYSPKAQYGNAIKTVGYSTDGEGSDWMFGEKEIVAFSPELGSSSGKAESFYVAKEVIFEVIQENYKIVDLFMQRNTFIVQQESYSIGKNNFLNLSFKNAGLSMLYDSTIILECDSSLILSIAKVHFRNQYEDFTEIAYETGGEEKNKRLILSPQHLSRLEEFELKMEMKKDFSWSQSHLLSIKFISNGGKLLAEKYFSVDGGSVRNYTFLIQMSLLTLILVGACYFWMKYILYIMKLKIPRE